MKLTARVNTIVKSHPINSSSPDRPDGFVAFNLPEGESIEYRWIRNAKNNHFMFELAQPVQGRFNWYAFKDHVQTSNNTLVIPNDTLVTARFEMKLGGTFQLRTGILSFWQNKENILQVEATSGAPGFQYSGAWTIQKRGVIPPARDWKINIRRDFESNVKGVEGRFFPILPDRFGRSALGLHRDANAPGSAGCVVVRNSKLFNEKVVPLLDRLDDVQSTVNLEVIYR
jgi:hypothetical protein